MKKRLLALAVMGAALALCAVMVFSLRGDDKPQITNDQPADNQQPASTSPTKVRNSDTQEEVEYEWSHKPVKHTDDGASTDDSDDDTDQGNGNGNGNGNGQSDNPNANNVNKTHGLERAIEVHIRNIEKQEAKHGDNNVSADGKGLQNSLEHLQMNLEKQASHDVGLDDHANNGNGQAKGNSNHA